MSYNKTNWVNDTVPAINDVHLNNIENGIKNCDSALGYDDYDNTSTYAVGAYCIYDNKLYKCTTAVSSAEDFDSTKWNEVNIKTMLNDLQSKTQTFSTYYNAWGNSITFYLPLGRHAILMRSQNTFYTVWNTNTAIEWAIIFGSGVSITRDSSDNTKITASKTDNATWTVVVF